MSILTMKKIIAILFLIPCLHASAREEAGNRYYLGISPGINYSRMTIDPNIDGMFDFSTDQDFRLGYSGGLVFIYYPEPRKGVQMELNYSQRGWTESSDTIGTYDRKLEYFEFPVLSHFDLGSKSLHFTITVGPAISYLLSSHQTIDLLENAQMKSYYDLAVDNKMEIGLCIGLGVNKFIGRNVIQLECRLNQGLSSMFRKENSTDLLSSQNQVLGVKLSYLFGW